MNQHEKGAFNKKAPVPYCKVGYRVYRPTLTGELLPVYFVTRRYVDTLRYSLTPAGKAITDRRDK